VVMTDFVREIINVDDLTGRKGACPFHRVLELADVARPWVSQHLLQSILRVPGDRTLHFTGDSGEQCLCESSKILRPLPKRWYEKFYNSETVE